MARRWLDRRRVGVFLAGMAGGLVALATSLASSDSQAQPQPDKPAEPEAPKPAKPAPEAPPDGDAQPEQPGAPVDDEDFNVFEKKLVEGDYPDLLEEALKPAPAGLKPGRVAARSAQTSPQVAVSQAELRAAASRVDQALAAYFPRATLGASYTRQSPVETDLTGGVTLPPGVDFGTFAVIENVYMLTASLEVPLSDYATRLVQAYDAVTLDVEARELAVEASKRQAAANALVAYFNWIRAQGQIAVSQLGSVQAELHVADAKASLAAGLVAEADVMRLEAQLALARHLTAVSIAFEKVAAQQLRTQMHLEPGVPLAIGVDVMGADTSAETRTLPALTNTALNSRPDLKALRRGRKALDEAASATRGTYYPRVAAFANGVYANPNPRIFPQENKWDFTWDVGVRLTWTINDTFTTIGASREAESQALSAEHQVRGLEDAIRLEVTAAYYDVQNARSAIVAADKREEAAMESLKARRLLFRGGRATATDMVDAQAELTAARLQRLDAHVDLLVARTKLDHAIGK